MSFKKINIEELKFNPFEKIGKQWMLLTAGNKESWNTMTASWGQLGVLWNKNVLTCYIRTSRHTLGFVEDNDTFTASFFGEEMRSALAFCGAHSGRDCDKAKETGLVPEEIDGTVTFAQSELVLVCKKLYTYDIEKNGFFDKKLNDAFYTGDAYHRTFIAEIVSAYVKE